jgi:hypothetical protein
MTAMDIVAVVVVGFWLHGGMVESRYSRLATCVVETPVGMCEPYGVIDTVGAAEPRNIDGSGDLVTGRVGRFASRVCDGHTRRSSTGQDVGRDVGCKLGDARHVD